MKKYLVFNFDRYESMGGMNDFLFDTDDLNEILEGYKDRKFEDVFQIWNTKTDKVSEYESKIKEGFIIITEEMDIERFKKFLENEVD